MPSGEASGMAVCFRAALSLKVQSDPAWISKKPADELGLIHQFGMSGCPLGSDKCTDIWGNPRFHPTVYEDIPICNFDKCTKGFCIFRHNTTSAALSVANNAPTISNDDTIVTRNHNLEDELKQVRNLYSDIFHRYEKLCSACTGACGVVTLLPPPTRTSEGQLTFDDKVTSFLFTAAQGMQSNQILQSYAALNNFPWQPTFDDVASTWGWSKPSLQTYVPIPPQASSSVSRTFLQGTSMTPMEIVLPNRNVNILPDAHDATARIAHASQRMITVPTVSSTSLAESMSSPTLNHLTDIHLLCMQLTIRPPTTANLHLAILQLFAPPRSLECACSIEFIRDMPIRIAHFDAKWGTMSLMSHINMASPTHAFFIECYFSFMVSRYFLISVVGRQPPPVINRRPLETDSVGAEYLPILDGRILRRSSCDAGNTSVNLHQRCGTALWAFHLSSNNRYQIVQRLVDTFLGDSDFHINHNVSLISQLLAWMKQRPELKFLLSHVTPWINRPALIFKGVGRSDANHIAINTDHPYRNNFVNMIQRVHNGDGYASDISCDPAFIGLYAPDVFDEHAYDPFAFFAYTYTLVILHGFKPGYSDVHSSWCIDRTDTTLHYTICNMRWLSLEQNAANRSNAITMATQQQFEREQKRARIRASRRIRLIKARNKSFK